MIVLGIQLTKLSSIKKNDKCTKIKYIMVKCVKIKNMMIKY